jgi:hypothetical protein
LPEPWFSNKLKRLSKFGETEVFRAFCFSLMSVILVMQGVEAASLSSCFKFGLKTIQVTSINEGNSYHAAVPNKHCASTTDEIQAESSHTSLEKKGGDCFNCHLMCKTFIPVPVICAQHLKFALIERLVVYQSHPNPHLTPPFRPPILVLRSKSF